MKICADSIDISLPKQKQHSHAKFKKKWHQILISLADTSSKDISDHYFCNCLTNICNEKLGSEGGIKIKVIIENSLFEF